MFFELVDFLQIIAVLSSLMSLAWSLAAYNRSLRFPQPDKLNITYKGTVIQFLWHFCGISKCSLRWKLCVLL